MLLIKQVLALAGMAALGAVVIAPLLGDTPERGAMFAVACYLAALGIVGVIDILRGRRT
jgi:hypothetical protein